MNDLEIVAVVTTVKVAVLLAAPAVVVCVVVTPDVVLLWTPGVLLVTLKVTVQLPLPGMVIPEKVKEVWPAVKLVPAAQLPPTTPPTALIFTSVSVNAAPVRADALLFVSVKVTVDVAPDSIEVGLKPLEMVGALNTVNVAVLLPVPAVGVWVVATPEVVLGLPPTVLLVTLKVTVQLPLAGMVIPEAQCGLSRGQVGPRRAGSTYHSADRTHIHQGVRECRAR